MTVWGNVFCCMHGGHGTSPFALLPLIHLECHRQRFILYNIQQTYYLDANQNLTH